MKYLCECCGERCEKRFYRYHENKAMVRIPGYFSDCCEAPVVEMEDHEVEDDWEKK